ncbi:LADA_0C00452g1_1 [Lachancea dasiensis]|uniref:LADA_0C00452g1_1 n=1 Tax=Lachancea dasiensis TaxID=1072105 RepID=A0A1G4IX40_9SACH|nr:LADA_0C00452g1_1 [Lachancea dasiensis]
MSNSIVQDVQVRDHFLTASRDQVIAHVDLLHSALVRYSNNPSIIPPRHVGPTPDGSTTFLIMSVVDDLFCGVKSVGCNPASGQGFVGGITVTDPKSGSLVGVVQAKQLTAARTALSSCIGLVRVSKMFGSEVQITAFGTGLQAFWHVYFACKILEDKKIRATIVYRSSPLDTSLFDTHLPQVEISQIPFSDKNAIATLVGGSDVIFGCVPSSEPAILMQHLDASSSTKYTYISLIGSYKPHMHECDGPLVEEFKNRGVPILVDSIEHTLTESGELIDADIEPEHLQELGRLRDTTAVPIVESTKGNKFTLCKIVGLAIMDICMAQAVLSSVGKEA